jgi:serine/threonine protein kinase
VAADEALTRAALTQEGSILGTLQYMAPEQLQGKAIDTRADIFSFGCMLYEMLTGKRAFDGANSASVIAAILERPAPSVRTIAPAALDRVLKRCLEKDPDERWQSVGDLRFELEWIAAGGGAEVPRQALARPTWWIAATAVATLIAAGLAFLYFRPKPPVETPIARFSIEPPKQAVAIALSEARKSGAKIPKKKQSFDKQALLEMQ